MGTGPRAVAFGAALLTYAVLLLISIAILSGGGVTSPPLQALVALLPVPAAVALLVLAITRFLATDEMQQQIQLTALALSFLGTLLVTFSWGFLEGVGVERLSGFAVFGTLVLLYVAGLALAGRRYR